MCKGLRKWNQTDLIEHGLETQVGFSLINEMWKVFVLLETRLRFESVTSFLPTPRHDDPIARRLCGSGAAGPPPDHSWEVAEGAGVSRLREALHRHLQRQAPRPQDALGERNGE